MAGRDEIIAYCDELLDIGGFDDYGPNGMQVPGLREVSTLASGVTANRRFLELAVEAGAELALVHHGLFFGEPGGLSEQLANRLRVVLAADLSLAAYHLPLDAHREIGNNALLCQELGLEPDPRPFGEVKGRAVGVIGIAREAIDAAELVRRVKSKLDREPMVFSSGPERIRTVGIVTGAGARALEEAAALGLDALITGEPAEHAMGDAEESRIHFIAAGHYATETLGIRRLGELVAQRFEVGHRFIDVPNPI